MVHGKTCCEGQTIRKSRVMMRLDQVLKLLIPFRVSKKTLLGGSMWLFSENKNFHFDFLEFSHLNFNSGTSRLDDSCKLQLTTKGVNSQSDPIVNFFCEVERAHNKDTCINKSCQGLCQCQGRVWAKWVEIQVFPSPTSYMLTSFSFPH